jgi:proteasome lid subunit RPN8/RPN11
MAQDRVVNPDGSQHWRVPEAEQLETDAYHIWKPRPLLRSVHWKTVPEVPREAAAGAYDVFVDQRAFVAMHQHIWEAGAAEGPFGYLIGDLCEDPESERRYIIISAAIRSKFPFQEEGAQQVSGEASVALQLEVDRRRGILAGWYHRHRQGPVRLSAADLETHDRLFPEPWQIALLFVADSREPAGGCFRRTLEGLSPDQPLPFYEMVSNESLMARGVRRSRLDWHKSPRNLRRNRTKSRRNDHRCRQSKRR